MQENDRNRRVYNLPTLSNGKRQRTQKRQKKPKNKTLSSMTTEVNSTTKMLTVEKRVSELLETHEHLRNSDHDLITVYWRAFDNYDAPAIPKTVTPASSIIRARAKLQHKGQFIPTNAKVRKQRRIKQETMRHYARAR